MVHESAFEKFKPVDDVLRAYPVHAADYAEIWQELSSEYRRMSAEEKLNLIALKVLNHKKAIENHAKCNLCKLEPIWIARLK